MKKIKLFALAVMAMLGTNAMAGDSKNVANATFFDALGIQYQIISPYVKATTTTPAVQGTVKILKYNNTLLTTDLVIPESTNNVVADIDIPDTYLYKVVEIADYSTTNTQFKGAKAGKITIPATVTKIGQGAFEDIEATEVAIGSGSQLTAIRPDAFKNAKNLATFGSANALGLAWIGANAFEGTALTSFTFGVDLAGIGAEAFKGTKIVTLDFSACSKFNAAAGANIILRWFTDDSDDYKTNTTLTTVKLPTSVATTGNKHNIAANAFKGCTALTTIGATANTAIIPASVKTIGDGAFKLTNITKFDLSSNSDILTIGDWFSKTSDATTDPSKLQQVVLNNKKYTSFSGLTGISTLKKVGISGAEYALPANTTAGAIAAGVFAGTALEQLDLSKITVPVASLPALFYSGSGTVFGITSLTSVTLNNQTTELAANAFAGCTNLATLAVKQANGTASDLKAMKTVNTAAFWGTKLSSLTFGSALATLTTPFNYPATATAAQQALARSNATALSIDLSASTALMNSTTVVLIAANTFQKVAALTSIKLPTTLQVIEANAFEGTGITEIDLPATIIQNNTAADRGIRKEAFKDCASLTKMTFYPATETNSIFATDDVFSGCGMVGIYTTATYAAIGGPNQTDANTKKVPPTYSKWVTSSPEELTTVKDKVKNYAMKGFYSEGNYRFDAAECDVYEAYIDGENIVLSPLRKRNGKYNVPANNAVIVRTSEAKTISPLTYTPGTDADASSLVYGAMSPSENALKSVLTETARTAVYKNYMYVLVNNATAGFSFQHFTGSKINKGNIYVINSAKVPAAGRLNMIWLDENGNVVEDETTAIESINAAEAAEGEIYNLQGVRVNGAQKGIYIKNGKKFIVK